MTTELAPAPAPRGIPAVRLIRAELLKVWTTNTWWIIGILALVTTGLTLSISLLQADAELNQIGLLVAKGPPDFSHAPPPEQGGPTQQEMADQLAQYRAAIDVTRVLISNAANIFTAGQFCALLFIVILGALIVTNEFFHHTATTTFLTTPHRTRVIVSKVAAAMVLALAFWAVLTLIDVGIGSIYFALSDYTTPLTDWPVVRAVLMNLLAFAIWGVLGIGLGVLLRSQLAATLTAAAAYLLSYVFGLVVFGLIRQYVIQQDWVWNWMVSVPGVASQVMISTTPMPLGGAQNGLQWWVGAIVLVGYGLAAGTVGTLITRKRDIS